MKKFLAVFALFSLVAVLVAACGGSSSTGGGTSSSGTTGTAVHMNDTNFVQPSVTIKKGESLNLIDDAAVVHIIQNGTWNNGTAQPSKEPGAPTVQAQFQGNDQHAVGPFNTAGTYKLYCTVHPGMNLTVIVQ